MLNTDSKIITIDDALDYILVGTAYQGLLSWNLPPNMLWIPISAVKNGTYQNALKNHLGAGFSSFILKLLYLVLANTPSNLQKKSKGFEIWLGKTSNNSTKIFLHKDVDEGRKAFLGIEKYPLQSAIFHLGPKTLDGGETFFYPSTTLPKNLSKFLYTSVEFKKILSCNDTNWISIPQKENRLILFNGEMPHFVAPILSHPKNQPRLAILINLWDSKMYKQTKIFGKLSSYEMSLLQRVSLSELKTIMEISSRIDVQDMSALINAFKKILPQTQDN